MDSMDNVPELNAEMPPEQINNNNDAPTTKKRNVGDMQNTILSYLHDLVFLLVALLLLFVLLFRIVVVSGPSMESTLYEGDYLIVLSSSIYTKPKAGDVVVVSKDSFDDGKPIVKRVIATSGQTVDIRGGEVYVNGEKVEGKYTTTRYDYNYPSVGEEGCIFVLGDNRENSKDSRHSEIGMIDEREVLGKVLFLALPAPNRYTGKRDFSRIGAV